MAAKITESPVKWRQQLGLDMPESMPGCIWIHACSVGEVSSVAPLIRVLREKHPVHLSVVTATGFAQAKRLLGHAMPISWLPWDLPGSMMRWVRHMQPSLLLLTETEFWPGMLKACKRLNVPVIGINTRISDRSFPGYRRTAFLWRRWLKPVAMFLAQSDVDAERLAAIGVDRQRIKVAGNMKYAVTAPAVDAEALRRKVDATGQRPVLVVASTHEQEESAILDMLQPWLAERSDLLVLVVPRHPQRFDMVAELIHQHGYRLQRWSEAEHERSAQIILVDAMGILAGLYSIADIVIVGGSLVDIGGHNPLEPAICGRGVITGPYVQNFRAIMDDMRRHNAAIIANNHDELAAAVLRLLRHPDELRELHAQAASFMADKSQVLDRILGEIQPYFPTGERAEK